MDYYNSDNYGHIYIKITNDSKDGNILEVNKGDAIAQGIILSYYKTEDDNATNKRNGGFGSTTKCDYSLPLGYDMYDSSFCKSKCKTACGRRIVSREQAVTASDFTNYCTRFQIDLNQFESVFEAASVRREATGE